MDPWCVIPRQFRPNRGKNCKFNEILKFGGSYTKALDRSWSDLACESRPIVYAYTPNFICLGLFCGPWGATKAKFDRILKFGILWWHHSAVQTQKWTRVRDYKPSRTKGITIVSIFHRLDNEVVGTHSVVPFKSMTDKKKTKNIKLFLLLRRHAKSHFDQSGMMIAEVVSVLSSPQTLAIWVNIAQEYAPLKRLYSKLGKIFSFAVPYPILALVRVQFGVESTASSQISPILVQRTTRWSFTKKGTEEIPVTKIMFSRLWSNFITRQVAETFGGASEKQL